MKHLWCFSIARGFLKKETSSWLVWKPCISGGCNKAVWFFPLQRQRELMKELSGFAVWECIHFFLIVWIICLKEEATRSFVLLFLGVIWLWVWECSHSYLPELPLCCGWTLLINRRITRWNNILSKLKTSPKRYGHLKTKHWHLLYECFREKNWKCLWKIRHLKKHICVWQKADTGSWCAHYIRWLSLWMGGTTLLTRFTMSMSTEQK